MAGWLVLFCAGAYRGPDPPSMPSLIGVPGAQRAPSSSGMGYVPAPEALGELRTSLHAPLIKYRYEWQQGFIGAGDDVSTPRRMTISAALTACDAEVRCRAVTHEGGNGTSGLVKAYLKSVGGPSGSVGWSTWIKIADVGPPAVDLAVGGTSRLRLRLRTDFFTAQNLSRVNETWSFTRPLDTRSALPMAAHLGDVTLRLRPAARAGAAGLPEPTDVPAAWSTYSTIALAAAATPVDTEEELGPRVLAAHDISGTFGVPGRHPKPGPTQPPFPLRAVRSWSRSADGAALILALSLTNRGLSTVEVGGLGFAMPESDGHPPKALSAVVWAEPHVGGIAGNVQFVRVVDDEATLVVTPARGEDAHGGLWRERDHLKTTRDHAGPRETAAPRRVSASTAAAPGPAASISAPRSPTDASFAHTGASVPTAADAAVASAWPAPLEAWRPMMEDSGDGDAWEWCVASSAWADDWATNRQWPFLDVSDSLAHTYPSFADNPQTPWPATDGKKGMPLLSDTAPWNTPTSFTLAPAETRIFALRLQLADDGPRSSADVLRASGAPVLQGVPGFVLGADMNTAELHVTPPQGSTTLSATSSWAHPGAALRFDRTTKQRADGIDTFRVTASGRGRATATIAFSDGTNASAHYFVVPSFRGQISSFGSHLADTAWLPRDFPDPFGRSASVMPWDRSFDCGSPTVPCGHVLNDARAYDVGLSDDAGGGNPLALASKVRASPTAHEASRIDEYIRWTLYGVKPDTASPPLKSLQIREEELAAGEVDAEAVDGVRMTMFYYSANLSNSSSGHFGWDYTEADKCHKPFGSPTWCMTENMANATYRGFNYPHQIASYWAMYTVARHTGFPTAQSWGWYLNRAGRTCLKLGTSGVGFMDGTVAREVLVALKTEGAANATFAQLAATLESNMATRQAHWAATPYPYGSEFGFDTTGQEEVVIWSLYFGDDETAKKTVDHILSYMRDSATWAYHGGGRSWGDVGNNGKYLATFGTGSQDRGQMHYRAGLNMIPLLEWYRKHPDDFFTLQVSMGAIVGQMANIDATGAGSMMFHAVPHVMDFDPHSGDFGLGMFGNALESGAYLVDHPRLGLLCYLCDLLPAVEYSFLEEATLQAAAGIMRAAAAAPDDDSKGPPAGGSVHGRSTRAAGIGTEANFPLVRLAPKDGYRVSIFVEPLGLYLQSDCGAFSALTLDRAAQLVLATYEPATHCPALRVRLTKAARDRPGDNFSVPGARLERGAWSMSPAANGGETVVIIRYDDPTSLDADATKGWRPTAKAKGKRGASSGEHAAPPAAIVKMAAVVAA